MTASPIESPLRGARRERVLAGVVALLQPVASRWRLGWNPALVRKTLAMRLCELHQEFSVEQAEILIVEASERVVWPTILDAG